MNVYKRLKAGFATLLMSDDWLQAHHCKLESQKLSVNTVPFRSLLAGAPLYKSKPKDLNESVLCRDGVLTE